MSPSSFRRQLEKGKMLDHLLYEDAITKQKGDSQRRKFLLIKAQNRLVLENNGLIDPTKIEDYIAIGRVSSLCKSPISK